MQSLQDGKTAQADQGEKASKPHGTEQQLRRSADKAVGRPFGTVGEGLPPDTSGGSRPQARRTTGCPATRPAGSGLGSPITGGNGVRRLRAVAEADSG